MLSEETSHFVNPSFFIKLIRSPKDDCPIKVDLTSKDYLHGKIPYDQIHELLSSELADEDLEITKMRYREETTNQFFNMKPSF